MERYESWKRIRARALENANGHLPEGFAEDEPLPPPPPSPDGDIVDLAMDLSAVSIDGEVPHELDDSGIERVPTADPGLDVSTRRSFSVRANDTHARSDPSPKLGPPWNSRLWEAEYTYAGEVYCQVSELELVSKKGTDERAVDPTVLRDLQAHRSLDDGLGPRAG